MRLFEPQPGQFLAAGAVRILDEDMNPVDGALVEIEWQRPVGPLVPQARRTRPNGVTAIKLQVTDPGTYTLCVINVASAGYEYDPSINGETCDSIEYP